MEQTEVAQPAAVDRALLPGEEEWWTGPPDPGVVFAPSDALMIPFSLIWGGFAIFWETTVALSGAPVVMRLFGVPFVLVGRYLIAGRFPAKRVQRRRTTYALTDRRALVVNGRSVRSAPISDGPSFTRESRSGHRLTIGFGQVSTYAVVQLNTGSAARNRDTGVLFEDVVDVAGLRNVVGRWRRLSAAERRSRPRHTPRPR